MESSPDPVPPSLVVPTSPPYFTVDGVTFSADTSKLDEALAVAQAKFEVAKKTAQNAAYKRDGKASKYADIESVYEACRKALGEAKIAVVQSAATITDRNPDFSQVRITTRISHAGQFIQSGFSMPRSSGNGNLTHAVGGTITYARRYGLLVALGIASEEEDDDGNTAAGIDAAAGRNVQNAPPAKSPPKNHAPGAQPPPPPLPPADPFPNYEGESQQAPTASDLRKRLKSVADEKFIGAKEMGDIIERVTGRRVKSDALTLKELNDCIVYVEKLLANPDPKGGKK